MAKDNEALADRFSVPAKAKTVGGALVAIHGALTKHESKFAKALGRIMPPERFVYVVYTYVRKNESLWDCTPDSIVAAAMEAAELGLNFSVRNEAFMVPYSGKATFQAGYKGIAKLALNSEFVQSLTCYEVREGDQFELELGSTPRVRHVPNLLTRGEVTGFYAVAVDQGGNVIPEYMTVPEVEAWAKKHIKSNKGPFSAIKSAGRKGENFEAYGLKTVLLRLCNRKLPLTPESSRVIDNELKTEQERIEDAIELGDEALWASIKEDSDKRIEQMAQSEDLGPEAA